MLAISISYGGAVKIGDDITIYNNDDHPLRIAIDAPRDIIITRLTNKQAKAQKK